MEKTMESLYVVKRDGEFYGPFYNGQDARIFAGDGPYSSEIIRLRAPHESQGEAMARMQARTPFSPY